MTPERLLRRLRDAGFSVRAEDGDLVVSPAGPLKIELRERLRRRKPELLSVLATGGADPAEPDCVDCGRTLPLSGVRCPDCRDALEEPTCASCGAVEEETICDLCRIEAQAPLDAETREEA